MKKRIFFDILVISIGLILSACQLSETEYLASLGEETDTYVNFKGNNTEFMTDKGVYLWSNDGEYATLQYVDFEKGKPVPVCDKVNCSHESKECNANLKAPVMQMCAYGDYIYVIGNNEDATARVLYRFSFDGSVKEELLPLTYLDENDIGQPCSYQFIVYKGYGYLVQNNTSEDLSKEYDVTLQKIRLEKSGKVEDVFTLKGLDNMMFLGKTDDEGIYIQYAHLKSEKSMESQEDYYYYNVNTGKTTLISELEGKGLKGVKGDIIYYSYVLENDNQGLYCAYNIKDKTEWEVFDCKASFLAYYDNDYTYLDTYFGLIKGEISDSERKIYVLNNENKLVDTYDNLGNACIIAIKDGRVLTVESTETEQNYKVINMNDR